MAKIDFATTTDVNPVAQLNTILDNDDQELTLRTADGRNHSSLMSLQQIHKSQGSPVLGHKRGSRSNNRGE